MMRGEAAYGREGVVLLPGKLGGRPPPWMLDGKRMSSNIMAAQKTSQNQPLGIENF